MRADEQTRTAVNEALIKMAQAMETKDIDAFMKLFSKDQNMLTIGPEEAEMSLGPGQLKERMEKTFTEAETLSLKYGWTSIKANGPAAWVASHVYYNIKKKGQEEISLSARLTGVLEKIDNQWLWTQQHFSVARNIEEGIVKALKQLEAEKAKAAEAEAAKAQAEQAKAAAPPEEPAKVEPAEAEQAEAVEKPPAETKPPPKEKPIEEDIFYELE